LFSFLIDDHIYYGKSNVLNFVTGGVFSEQLNQNETERVDAGRNFELEIKILVKLVGFQSGVEIHLFQLLRL